MASPAQPPAGAKRRVRGQNIESIFRDITNDDCQVPKRRIRGKNVDKALSSVVTNNCTPTENSESSPITISNKENEGPNIQFVAPSLTSLPVNNVQVPVPARVNKVRARGRRVDNIFKGVLPRTLTPNVESIRQPTNDFQTQSMCNYGTPTHTSTSSCPPPSGELPRRTINNIVRSTTTPTGNCTKKLPNPSSRKTPSTPITPASSFQQCTLSSVGDLGADSSNKRHRKNNEYATDRSGQSTVSFETPVSRGAHFNEHGEVDDHRSPDVKNNKHQVKKFAGKISPVPLSFDGDSVKSTFEIGESSRRKNLKSNCNFEEDNCNSDSDTTIESDTENMNEEEINTNTNSWQGYMDIGVPDKVCSDCDSIMWNEERNNKKATKKTPTFSLCCKSGQVCLEKEKQPPEPLATLLSGGVHFTHFKQNIRIYNCMFAMTSIGGKIQHRINKGGAPYCFKLQGQNYHLIGSLLPIDGEGPKFSQLYIYDTENEINNRINAVDAERGVADPQIVESLLQMLDEHNKLVRGFRMARERVKENAVDEFKLVLISSSSASGRPNHIGPSNEVAGLIVTDNDYTKSCRDTVIHSRKNGLERIKETDARFMQLQYPILFPHGDEGFHLEIPLNKTGDHRRKNAGNSELDPPDKCSREYVTLREYYNYKLMIRLTEGLTPHLGGRLWQQYVVDAFTAIEQYRLDWIRTHQTTIRADLYSNVRDAVRKGDNNPTHVGKSVILPASFTGCQRYMNQYFKDSLAICRALGHPSLFLTMTCNTKWPEIQRMLKYLPGVDVADAPDVVSRVFKLKVDRLIRLVKKENYFGRCIGVMHVIEFQKRGLPHAHMLIWLHPDDRPKTFQQIDHLVSAELPDPEYDKVGYEAVKNYMIHGPCGSDCLNSPCMVRGKCIKHFPKRYNGHTFFDDYGFAIYKRRRTGVTVEKKGVQLDNRYVVPYNRDLLARFQCHMNLEICNNSRSLKYLFKYCLKGHDTATMLLKKKKDGNAATVVTNREKGAVDEVKQYLDGRYVCASEAAWRIFGFDIHSRWPSVERLPLHMPGDKHLSFKTGDVLEEVCDKADSKKSKLEAWFDANKTLPNAKYFTYSEFPSRFTWHPRPGIWKERKRGDVVGRLPDVHSTSGELLYLRMLLLRKKGSTSFEDLRTVDGHVHQSFMEACSALGLLQNDQQWHEAIAENSHTSLPPQLREMFVNILAYSPVSDPFKLWECQWRCMSDDILLRRRHMLNGSAQSLSDEDVQNYTLAEIEKLLNDIGKSLRDYPSMPFPRDEYFSESVNRLIMEETGYDRAEMKSLHERNHQLLNAGQKIVYDALIENINHKKGGLFFVYGSGGCGKTFLWQTLCCRLRSEGKIVLPVASSGIAATLLPGGRTAHSRFHIPLKLDQYSTAGIAHGSDIAELLKMTSLIIWDEAPMQHRYGFECVDRSLRDIMSAVDKRRSKKPFGGITVVFGGDFRQILPVIPKSSRAEIVAASLNSSKLWDFCQVFLLKQNMRLNSGNTNVLNQMIAEFSRWQLAVGDGKVDNISTLSETGAMEIKIPDQYVVRTSEDPIEAIFNVTYPDFLKNMSSHSYLRSRAILTPTNAVVDDINKHIIDKIQGTTHIYLSQDSMDDAGDEDNDFSAAFPVEYLNSINIPCIPKHELKLKVGVVVMLMRNLNQIMGLCNGTRMIVTACRKNSVECEILCGSQVGTKHLIPRIEMMPTDTVFPFQFKRTQFPLQICYAMTINKSQGQSLDCVGLYLPRSAFSHGHIYVAISRVTRPEGLHVLIVDDDGSTTNITSNVVFEEVFYNLPSIDD